MKRKSRKPSRVPAQNTSCGSGCLDWDRLYSDFFLQSFWSLSMDCLIEINGSLGKLAQVKTIRDDFGVMVDWREWGLSGVACFVGEKNRQKLTPESLLLMLIRFLGWAVVLRRSGSMARGVSFVECSSRLFKFLKSLFEIHFRELVKRLSIGTCCLFNGEGIFSLESYHQMVAMDKFCHPRVFVIFLLKRGFRYPIG